ncbi:TIM barrel protein [Roseobacter weihaiensis]|uniref:TIM barrel protein n=1 Tax=Roseobacter weihaiensis TaxID=2763262 RepID=UPI001D0A4A66|nr:TIM barrel protein [Roseobacter sp. H9]
MKLAANISRLWAELPYLDRFDVAAEAGFDGVAVPFPYDMPAKETQRAAWRSALPVVQISAPPPNYTGGGRGFAAVPGLEARFQYDLRRALRYCEALRVPVLHLMAGEASGAAARETLLANLRHASATVPEGLALTIGPQPTEGAFLGDFDMTAEIIAEIGSPNIGLRFHSGHAALLHGDAVAVFEKHAARVRQIQLADTPGAGVPGTGQIDLPRLVQSIRAADYKGWVVADYDTGPRTEATLTWLPLFRD